MAYLMRMIDLSKWTQRPNTVHKPGDIDAVSLSDLSAENNEISTWYLEELSEPEIQKVVLALVSNFSSLDEVMIVFLNYDDVVGAGLSINTHEAPTKIEAYAPLHRNIEKLNADRLVILANLILQKVWADEVRAINAEELVAWFLPVLNQGILDFNTLNKNFRSGFAGKVKKLFNKSKVDKQSLQPFVIKALQDQWELNKKKTNCKYESICPKYGHAS